MDNTPTKEKYQTPQIEVIQVENEGGVMAASANIGNFTENNDMFPGGSAKRSTSSNVSTPSSMQDLEDLINDIFTVSK